MEISTKEIAKFLNIMENQLLSIDDSLVLDVESKVRIKHGACNQYEAFLHAPSLLNVKNPNLCIVDTVNNISARIEYGIERDSQHPYWSAPTVSVYILDGLDPTNKIYKSFGSRTITVLDELDVKEALDRAITDAIWSYEKNYPDVDLRVLDLLTDPKQAMATWILYLIASGLIVVTKKLE